MRPYEGLNLPQLIDRMHDLIMPAPISFFPQTIGWVILLLWLVAVLATLVVHRFIQYRRNRYRREALVLLQSIQAKSDRSTQAADIAILLKRVALAAYARTDVGSLYGRDWADFLVRSCNNDSLIVAHAQSFAGLAYDHRIDPQQLYEPAKRWILVHHV